MSFYCVEADCHCNKSNRYNDKSCSECKEATKNGKRAALKVLHELVKTKQITN